MFACTISRTTPRSLAKSVSRNTMLIAPAVRTPDFSFFCGADGCVFFSSFMIAQIISSFVSSFRDSSSMCRFTQAVCSAPFASTRAASVSNASAV